jgi:hypothetical protein
MTRRRQWRPPPRSRFLAAVLPAALTTAVLAAPAVAKEGAEATLVTPVPLDAAPGEEITLAWTLTVVDEEGKRQPFNATGVYVELFSAGGGKSTIGSTSAEAHPTGEYETIVVVPKGGIGGIQIGLMGWANGEPSPLIFPITNSPLPDVPPPANAVPTPPPAAPAPTSESDGRSPAIWMALGLASLLAVGVAAAVLHRRRHPAAA